MWANWGCILEVESVVALYKLVKQAGFPAVSRQGQEFAPAGNQHTDSFIENVSVFRILCGSLTFWLKLCVSLWAGTAGPQATLSAAPSQVFPF